MTCIFLNPVVEQMYERETLHRFLRERGFLPVSCRENWGAVVREKYRKAAEETSGAVADVRCPQAARCVRKLGCREGLHLPDIEPILFHCAREISARPEFIGRWKLITTPCRILAEEGNALGLPETEFLTWNDFLHRAGETFPGRKLEKSPIPPGFFKGLENGDSLTGTETIESYLEEGMWKGKKIVEMLCCSGGCHNGDGAIEK